jgi:hypothetical protein
MDLRSERRGRKTRRSLQKCGSGAEYTKSATPRASDLLIRWIVSGGAGLLEVGKYEQMRGIKDLA